jgi:heme-degrading monooxygenase HmoA
MKMFARMSTIEGKAETVEEGIRHFKENVMPGGNKMPGFKKALLMVNRQTGKSVGITFWDSEKNLRASSEAADKLRARAAEVAGMNKAPSVEIYEVVIQP